MSMPKLPQGAQLPQPPQAKRIPHPHIAHGDVRQDDYYWLRDKTNPDVISYLEAENKYCEEMMRQLEPLTQRFYDAMLERVPETEQDVPVQDGEFFYYSRTEKHLPYPIFARKRAPSRDELEAAPEEVILDLNALAHDHHDAASAAATDTAIESNEDAEASESPDDYLSVTVQRVSPNHTYLAYLVNRDGTDKCHLNVKNMNAGTRLPEDIPDIFLEASVEWDSAGEYLFYATVDESQRPYRLWRHALKGDVADILLYEEADSTYTLSLSKSRSGRFLFLESQSTTTSEVHYIDLAGPANLPQLFDKRRVGILYNVEHWQGDFLMLTNEGADNFRLLHCPIEDPGPLHRSEVFPYDEARYLEEIYPFEDTLLILGRQDGLTQVWKFANERLTMLTWDESLYTVSMGDNRSYQSESAMIEYESLVTPRTSFSVNLNTLERTSIHVRAVSGRYDAKDYKQERIWATATDGTKIPVMAVYRTDALDNGPAPLVLYGYGAYGINYDAHFDPFRLPLLDDGVVIAMAQIRGGSEMGRTWYDAGHLFNKRNSFTDFIDSAKFLIHLGYTTSAQIAASGRSAGGLLMGAVANMAVTGTTSGGNGTGDAGSTGGHLFQAITPGVPFVDVVTTMLDDSIPLTTLEWDEWGNPARLDDYNYIKSYSPYDNVKTQCYPHMFVTAGLNDPRVPFWEPAKWVARLRATKTDTHQLLLKVNMGAGHFGGSGRFKRLQELAANYAFIVDKIGTKSV